jgi:peroxidase
MMTATRTGSGGVALLVMAMLVAAASSALPLPGLEETTTNKYNDTSSNNLSCRDLHGMVGSAVWAARTNPHGGAQITAGLLRIFFHDCFPQGCDASILLDGGGGNMIHNQGLQKQALDLVERIRATVHKRCGANSVSCADILALATAHAVGQSGGPWINIPLGRRDSLEPAQGWQVESLPRPDANVSTLLTSFAKKGLAAEDLVALSGAHTVGKASCGSFRDRLDNRSPNDQFAGRLAGFCGRDDNRQQNLDVRTPDAFDNRYFEDLVKREGVLTTDQGLLFDGRTSWLVHGYAKDQNWFFCQFAKSMEKMSRMGLGKAGEIRNHCSKRNVVKSSSMEEIDDQRGLAASA